MICDRCKQETDNDSQGHFWLFCNMTKKLETFHFCCPNDCQIHKPNSSKHNMLGEKSIQIKMLLSDKLKIKLNQMEVYFYDDDIRISIYCDLNFNIFNEIKDLLNSINLEIEKIGPDGNAFAVWCVENKHNRVNLKNV